MSEEFLRRRAAEEGWWDALLFDVGLAVVLFVVVIGLIALPIYCLLYTSPSPRDS